MKVVDYFKSLVVQRFSTLQDHRLPEVWSGSADSGELVTPSSAMGLSAVWACTNLIAGTISSLPLMVYMRDGETREEHRQHPLHRILRDSPNYDQTSIEFLEFLLASIELWGNAYARVERDGGGRVSALFPVAPDIVTVRRNQSGDLVYEWSEEGRRFERPGSTMLHIRGFGGNPLGGLSTLQFGRNTFGLARAVEKSASATFANGLRPSGALTFEQWLTAEQRDIAERRLVEKYIGAVNAGRPLILEGGTSWTPLTINPEDAQMLESRRFSIEEVCRFFGVPPVLIGHSEKNSSWPSSVEAQAILLQKFTLRRRVKRVEAAMMKQLLSPADRGRGVFIEFNMDGLLRGDSASRGAYYQTMTQMGAMTINEVRKLENLPPVEGGDVPRMQMQNVPITEAGNEQL